MPANPEATPSNAGRHPGIAVILVYDGLCAFEFAIAVELFDLERPELGVPWYDCRIVSCEGRRFARSGHIRVAAETSLDLLDRAGTIVLPGWRDRREPLPAGLTKALRAAHERGARIFSICGGAFALAHAGLLDGRRATTHWRHTDELAARFPRIAVERDVLYVQDGTILTSAGSAAGIDAGLHLIRLDHGARIANMVARRLVIPPHRDGGQAQYVKAPMPSRTGCPIALVLDWARGRLDREISVPAMAARAAMSERTFLRRFGEATGITPRQWLQRERIARAREMLESTRAPLPDVAEACGYRTDEAFRSAFRAVAGTSPAAYRRRFATV
jgi:AraC family transcriptional activator FtrA